MCAVYNPNGKDGEFSNRLLNMLSKVSSSDSEMVLLGDLNCDFLPDVYTKEVSDLKFVCDLHQLQQQIRLPTRVTDHSKTLIDLYFTSNPELYVDCGVIQTSISDHYMIYAIRKGKPVKSVNNVIDYRCYKNFNEESFLNDLFDVPWINVKKCDNVDDALHVWQCMFNDVVNKHIPKKTKRVRSAPSPWLNNIIIKQMSRRDYLHRKAVRSNSVSDWSAYKLCRNKVTGMMRESKKRYFEKSIDDCTGDSGKLWKTLNTILPKKRSVSPSSLDIDGKVLESDSDICNGFNKHFVDVARKLIDENVCASDNSDFDFNVYNCEQNVTNSDLCLPHVSCDFVNNEILGMSTGKATGFDDVSVKILKLARPAIVDSLTYIINMSLQTGVFPHEWKIAKVVPLHKGGSLNDANNYRPISILACASKILERAVHNHMYSFLVENNLLNPNQSGFRPHHSTETCLTDMIDNWLCNMNEGKMTGVAFIDLRKAFDTVNHSILLKKLHDLGANAVTLKWFKSYLMDRVQRVSFKKSLSDALDVNTGVPQGSILGPLLFIIFINSMSSVIKHGDIFMYADDTTLCVSGDDVNDIVMKLESDMKSISTWLSENKLFLNTDKTKVMLVGTSAKLRSVNNVQFRVTVDNKVLENVNSYKCLGVIVDNELKWHNQVSDVMRKVFGKLALLRRLKGFLDPSTLNTIYKALVQPHFDYCNIAWYGRFNEDIYKLNVLHKRCARVILGANLLTSSDLMFRELKWQTLSDRKNYFTALMVFKSLNGQAPPYLQSKFNYVRNIHECNTRHATAGLLALPPVRNGCDLECFRYCFSYDGVKVWNCIDSSIRNSFNVQSFKLLYKTYYWN